MFENLKNTFSNISKHMGETELKEKDISDILFELEMTLLESDVASEVAEMILKDLKSKLLGSRVEKKSIEKTTSDTMIHTISRLFDDAGAVDLFAEIDRFRESVQPYIIMFVGINGTGKTTSLAKVAHLLQKSKYSVAIAAADTFRAGAIEQLREHTRRLNLKIIAQNYGSDPAAVSRDAVLYARSHKVDCVLIDTAGRMQTSKNLMEQITKINKVVKPHLKIFVGDSLAGNDTVSQASEFHKHIQFNGSILTKADADARGGAALSIVKLTRTPVMFIGVGQEYDDLRSFDKDVFLRTVFGDLYVPDDIPADIPADATGMQMQDGTGISKTGSDATTSPPQTAPPPRPATTTPPPTTPPPPPATAARPATGGKTPPPRPATITPNTDTEKTSPHDAPLQPAATSGTASDNAVTLPPGKARTPQVPDDCAKPRDEPSRHRNYPGQGPPSATPSPSKPPPKPPQPPGSDNDPFKGLSDADIADYADMYDVPPPESDADAKKMAASIREWIKNGRRPMPPDQNADQKPDPVDGTGAGDTGSRTDHDDADYTGQHDTLHDTQNDTPDTPGAGPDTATTAAQGAEPKKKKGLFGFLKK